MDLHQEPEKNDWIQTVRPKILAWGVHLLTACGAVAGLLAILAIFQYQWKLYFIWMLVATLIDSVDGMLARAANVKTVLPGFDGALLDNIVDYFTYVVVPAIFLYEADVLPYRCALAGAVIILLASAYQFCQADAKTDDHYFKGFPSYWNVVVFYLFLLEMNPWVNGAVVLLLAILAFVPIRYIYPSRTTRFRRTTVTLTLLWGAALLVVLLRYPSYPVWLLWLSLGYVVYYFGISFLVTARASRSSIPGRVRR